MILKDKITVAIRQDRPERNIFKTIYLTRQQAERATASVNHYLQEQEMYLAVDVVYTADGWAVAVVTCY